MAQGIIKDDPNTYVILSRIQKGTDVWLISFGPSSIQKLKIH